MEKENPTPKKTTKGTKTNKTTTTKTSSKSTTKKASPKKTVKKTTPTKTKAEPIKKVETKTVKEVTSKEKEKKINPPKQDLEKTIVLKEEEKENISNVVENLSENQKNKKSHKKIITILTILIFVTIITSAIFIIKNEIRAKVDHQTLNSNVYEKVNRNYKENKIDINESEKKEENSKTNIIDITISDFENMVYDKEDFVTYIYSKTCLACLNFDEKLAEILKDSDKKVYRITITDMSEEEVKRFRTYYSFTSTPTLFVIQNGIVKSDMDATEELETVTNWINEYAK